MGEILDIYKLISDLIEKAKKVKNDDLVSSLIDIKQKVNELEDENRELKHKMDLSDSVIRNKSGTFITLKDDPLEIRYCSNCWGIDNKLVQLGEDGKCFECTRKWFEAMKR